MLLVEKNTPASDTRARSNYKLGREKGEEEGKRELTTRTRYIPRASCCWKGKKKRALHRPSPSTPPSLFRVSLTFAIFFGLSTLCKITSSLPLFLNERASVMLSTTTPSLIGQNGWFMCRPPCTWIVGEKREKKRRRRRKKEEGEACTCSPVLDPPPPTRHLRATFHHGN